MSGVSPHFRPGRHRATAARHRLEMILRFAVWDHVTAGIGLPAAA
ncbi:hypothetical protein AB0D08_27570 [Kitasatospora sp. NPDC048540]